MLRDSKSINSAPRVNMKSTDGRSKVLNLRAFLNTAFDADCKPMASYVVEMATDGKIGCSKFLMDAAHVEGVTVGLRAKDYGVPAKWLR
jgi:hypothetical protein